jgi:hypothetical protein
MLISGKIEYNSKSTPGDKVGLYVYDKSKNPTRR